MIPTDRPIAEHQFHVRYAETDAMGIVHHASYIVYFEEGRSHFIRQSGYSYSEFETDGFHLAVAEVNARYIQAIQYDRKIKILCWLAELKSRSLIFEYEIQTADTGERCVTGYTKHICLDHQGKVARIPQHWLDIFQTGLPQET